MQPQTGLRPFGAQKERGFKRATIRICSGSRSKFYNLLISTVDMSTQAANPVVPDIETARAESEKERLRLRRNIRFVKKTDELETAIHSILEC